MKDIKIKSKFKIIDNLTPALSRIQKTLLENELNRKLTDFEFEQIMAFEFEQEVIG